MRNYPVHTKHVIEVKEILKYDKELSLYDHLNTRIVKCASNISDGEFIGLQIAVPKKGKVKINLFSSDEITYEDLEWISEHSCNAIRKYSEEKKQMLQRYAAMKIYQLKLMEHAAIQNNSLGFNFSMTENDDNVDLKQQLPISSSVQFEELIKALQVTGGLFRCIVCPASDKEIESCKDNANHNLPLEQVNREMYIGTPVKVQASIFVPDAPSVRLKTVLSNVISNVQFKFVGSFRDSKCKNFWLNPLDNMKVYPEFVSKLMIMEPILLNSIIGIETQNAKVDSIPAVHKNTVSKKSICLGKAINSSGIKKDISIDEMGLKRHLQIVGQTGTGKSTLLANIILDAIDKDYGLTFFDPHGTTIDTILKCVKPEHTNKIKVIRLGDKSNPVPLNIWDSGDYRKEERNISDLCSLFGDIFDPRNEGIVGPRYERWLSTFSKASLAFLGKRASLESISVLSQSHENMLRLSRAIVSKEKNLVETIKEEYGLDNSRDFHNTLNWYLCKFERLVSVEQLRLTLGASVNALNFNKNVDTNQVTLIDLALPELGTHAATVLGTLILMKLWNAILKRKQRDKLHFIIVDEASLFQTNPMPRILAESRKFGVSTILCHQHTSQFRPEIRDALEANSANLCAFRLSPQDAIGASLRFNDVGLRAYLPSQDAFVATTSLCVDNKQTLPFTLEVPKPSLQIAHPNIFNEIEKNSIKELVDPYRGDEYKALSRDKIEYYLKNPDKRFWM